MRLPNVFVYAADLASARGAVSIKDLPGCFEMQIDDKWWCAFNGHGEPTKCSHGPEVTPYSVYFEYRGWPAGIVNASGGTAVGDLEDELIEALKASLAALRDGVGKET